MRMILALVATIALCVVAIHQAALNEVRSDRYLRDRVVMLVSPFGASCSGVEVQLPSGAMGVLSAGHCAELALMGEIVAIGEDKQTHILHILKVDKVHDLMLLSGFDDKALKVADSDYQYEKVHTMTHGMGMVAYRTDGELLDIRDIPVGDLGDLNVRMSTAKVLPGSSGGAVLNEDNQLVGIVSCTDGNFSGFVPLSTVKSFLVGQ